MRTCKKCKKTKGLRYFPRERTMCCTECLSIKEIKEVKPLKEKTPKVPKEKTVPWWAEGLTYEEYKDLRDYSSSRVWREDNREVIRHRNSLRKRDVKRATPTWLSDHQLKEIELLYIKATELEASTGVPHEVDHIIPLKGKNVSGLHVPWNLQVLPRNDNRRKCNKFPY